MRLPKLAVDNHQFVLVLVCLAVLLGIRSLLTMPRAEDPLMDIPVYSVTVVYPGVGPEDLEELIVDPIEDELNEIDEVFEIRTHIVDGLAVIRVEMTYGHDVDALYDDVVSAVNNVRNDLPDDVVSIDINQFSPLDVIIMELALVSETASYRLLKDTGEKLENQLNTVTGVSEVDLHAFPEPQVRITLDVEKMSAMQVFLPQVIGLLKANNANIPAGDLSGDGKSFTLKTSGGYRTLDEVRQTVLGTFDGHIVRLSHIAEVYFDYEDEKYRGRLNQQRAIFLSIKQKEGVQISSLHEVLTQAVESFKPRLPPDIDLRYVFLQAPVVNDRINDFFSNLLQGVALVGLIVLIFLGFRPSIIVMLVVPTSILIAIWTLDTISFGLQQISIVGLVIALGLLVDNGIVVVENIIRYAREGHPLREAVILGTGEVSWAVVSATATTVLAYYPMTQLGGPTGEYLQTLPLIVIFCLLASLVLALVFIPLLATKILRAAPQKAENRVERMMRHIIQHYYRPILATTLDRPFIILGIAALLFTGSLMLFPLVGVSFFPTADKPLLLIDIEMPSGDHLDRTDEAVRFVEGLLEAQPDVADYVANVGHGNPQVYYNRYPKSYNKNYGQVMANLHAWEADRFYPLLDTLRASFNAYPGARITVSEFRNGPPVTAPIEIKVMGEDLDTLKAITMDLERMIRQLAGTLNVDNPTRQDKIGLRVHINRDKASLLGVSIPDIDLAVRAGVAGLTVDEVSFDDGTKYDLVIRIPYSGDPSPEDLKKIYINSRTGTAVPLQLIADIGFERNPARIGHFNLNREATVTAEVMDGYNTTELTLDLINQLEAYPFPTGYTYYVAGEYEIQQRSFGDLGQVMMVALVGIFAVLVLQFRSFKQPFVVFSAIPLAFSGSIGALYLTGFSFSFFAFVGFTSLVGIVINNSIILVEFTNQLLEKGVVLREAIQQACETRFAPIVLTTQTTIVGLLPLTLTNSDLWSPLGWTIIGGMISSTALTLLIVPILLKWFSSEGPKAIEHQG